MKSIWIVLLLSVAAQAEISFQGSFFYDDEPGSALMVKLRGEHLDLFAGFNRHGPGRYEGYHNSFPVGIAARFGNFYVGPFYTFATSGLYYKTYSMKTITPPKVTHPDGTVTQDDPYQIQVDQKHKVDKDDYYGLLLGYDHPFTVADYDMFLGVSYMLNADRSNAVFFNLGVVLP